MTGTIKKLVKEKGFGFISRPGEEKDLFFHSENVSGVTFDELQEGDTLSFEVNDGVAKGKGPFAENVTRA